MVVRGATATALFRMSHYSRTLHRITLVRSPPSPYDPPAERHKQHWSVSGHHPPPQPPTDTHHLHRQYCSMSTVNPPPHGPSLLGSGSYKNWSISGCQRCFWIPHDPGIPPISMGWRSSSFVCTWSVWQGDCQLCSLHTHGSCTTHSRLTHGH